MDGSIRCGSVMVMCGVLLVGCGEGGSNDASVTGESREAGPASTLPSADMTTDLSSTVDEGSTPLGSVLDAVADKANETVDGASETVKGWIAEYEIRIGVFKAAIADYKPKIDNQTNEDAKMLIQRAENTVADIEQSVQELATVSEVEAKVRKVGIDQLVTDVETMINQSLEMLRTLPG